MKRVTWISSAVPEEGGMLFVLVLSCLCSIHCGHLQQPPGVSAGYWASLRCSYPAMTMACNAHAAQQSESMHGLVCTIHCSLQRQQLAMRMQLNTQRACMDWSAQAVTAQPLLAPICDRTQNPQGAPQGSDPWGAARLPGCSRLLGNWRPPCCRGRGGMFRLIGGMPP